MGFWLDRLAFLNVSRPPTFSTDPSPKTRAIREDIGKGCHRVSHVVEMVPTGASGTLELSRDIIDIKKSLKPVGWPAVARQFEKRDSA